MINRKNTDNLGDIAINLSMRRIIESIGNECISEDFSNPVKIGPINTEISNTEKNKSIIYRFWRSFLNIIRHFPLLYCYVWYFQNKRLFKVLENQHVDAVVIGGGELIQSNLIFPIALYWWTSLVHRHKIDKCILFAVGVTKEWNPYQKRIVCKSLKYINDIYVRDMESQHNMQVVFGRKASLVPDAVFVNPIVYRGKVEYSLYGITDFRRIKKYSKDFADKEAYYEYSIKEIKDIEGETQKEVILFYTTKADLNECRKFYAYCERMHNMYLKIANISVLDDLKAYISDAAIVVSPRMHACILGKLFCKDVRPILISKKMRSFAELYVNFSCDTSKSYRKQLISAMETALNN